MDKLLNIQEASEILNVSQDTLRKWERNGQLMPLKTKGGHRRYDPNILKEFSLNGARYFDKRPFTNEEIDWREIRIGNVVLEGVKEMLDETSYRTITSIDGKNWEYFQNGWYHQTTPEYCHWLVVGQKACNGAKLIRIKYDE